MQMKCRQAFTERSDVTEPVETSKQPVLTRRRLLKSADRQRLKLWRGIQKLSDFSRSGAKQAKCDHPNAGYQPPDQETPEPAPPPDDSSDPRVGG
jgi:hypothetical protein